MAFLIQLVAPGWQNYAVDLSWSRFLPLFNVVEGTRMASRESPLSYKFTMVFARRQSNVRVARNQSHRNGNFSTLELASPRALWICVWEMIHVLWSVFRTWYSPVVGALSPLLLPRCPPIPFVMEWRGSRMNQEFEGGLAIKRGDSIPFITWKEVSFDPYRNWRNQKCLRAAVGWIWAASWKQYGKRKDPNSKIVAFDRVSSVTRLTTNHIYYWDGETHMVGQPNNLWRLMNFGGHCLSSHGEEGNLGVWISTRWWKQEQGYYQISVLAIDYQKMFGLYFQYLKSTSEVPLLSNKLKDQAKIIPLDQVWLSEHWNEENAFSCFMSRSLVEVEADWRTNRHWRKHRSRSSIFQGSPCNLSRASPWNLCSPAPLALDCSVWSPTPPPWSLQLR